MKKILSLIFSMIIFCNISYASNASGLCAKDALQKLEEGNKHFASMHLKHPDISKKRLHSLEHGQNPFVAILSCSDSRVPPEIIFDQGLGDIFEIRNAGNVLDNQVIGSIEYALAHLGVKLVVILGHTDCGAVNATINNNHESQYIESLTDFITPAVQKAKTQEGDLYTNTSCINAKNAAEGLINSDSKIIKKYIKNNDVLIIPAIYDIHTGKVEFLK